ncbi:hypothetical protein [Hungatella effluvii]|nr:hypothetical protein [Hungatella effluvii]
MYEWIQVDGKWYYFDPEGSDGLPKVTMLADTVTPGGYRVDKDGVWRD